MAQIHPLIFNSDTERYELDGRGLHCGETLDVCLGGIWCPTRLEYGSKGWYLVGLPDVHKGVQLNGLYARQ